MTDSKKIKAEHKKGSQLWRFVFDEVVTVEADQKIEMLTEISNESGTLAYKVVKSDD